jgi:CHAT domain-containing protein
VKDGAATLDFMSTFYQYFFSGLEVRGAFAKTQKEMREKYKEPYLWAAFVLI